MGQLSINFIKMAYLMKFIKVNYISTKNNDIYEKNKKSGDINDYKLLLT